MIKSRATPCGCRQKFRLSEKIESCPLRGEAPISKAVKTGCAGGCDLCMCNKCMRELIQLNLKYLKIAAISTSNIFVIDKHIAGMIPIHDQYRGLFVAVSHGESFRST